MGISTTQGNLDLIKDGLQLYYDIGNPKSYNKILSELYEPKRIFNLSINDDIVIAESGSYMTFDKLYQPNYYGRIDSRIEFPSIIQCPSILDLTNESYTLQFIIAPVTSSIDAVSDENYILKSDSADGLNIKYEDPGSDPKSLLIGTINSGYNQFNCQTACNTDKIYMLTVVYNIDTGEYNIYTGAELDNTFQLGFTPEFYQSFKMGYLFTSFHFYGFRLYNKILTTNEIVYNYNQIKYRYGDKFY